MFYRVNYLWQPAHQIKLRSSQFKLNNNKFAREYSSLFVTLTINVLNLNWSYSKKLYIILGLYVSRCSHWMSTALLNVTKSLDF